MRNITRASVALAAAALLVGASATSASATDATVTVVGGNLTISVPSTSINFGSTLSPGATPTVPLTGVVVDDAQAKAGGWTASVTFTPLKDDKGNADPADDKTMTGAKLEYMPGTPANSGSTTATVTAANRSFVDGTVQEANNHVAVATTVGNNKVTWDANLRLTVPADAVIGTYKGTLTHSVL